MKKRTIVLIVSLAIAIMASVFTYQTLGLSKIGSSAGVEQGEIFVNYNDLLVMPKTTVYAELDCIGNFITSGNWTGVRLGYLLETMGIKQQVDMVELYAGDGYSTHVSNLTATRLDVIVAYEKDGVALSEVTRLVVPNTNGDLWISNIIRVKVILFSGDYTSIIFN